MVSVTHIQKANRLSKELKKHGFALDNKDAFRQAERIYSREKESPDVEFAEEGAVVEEIDMDDELMELQQRVRQLERHKRFAEKREKEYKDRISELVDKMNEMVKSINLVEMNQQSFQRQLNKVKKGEVSSESIEKKENDDKGASHRQEDTPDNTKKITTPIDQTGIAPSEVAVEKMFYSGSN